MVRGSDEIWLPHFHLDVLKRRVGNALNRLAHGVLERLHTEHVEEVEVTQKDLKDLRFETCRCRHRV